MTRTRVLLLTFATAHGWNDCAFPEVGYFGIDEGIGTSFSYSAAAMNGKLYTGGYTKGNFGLVGVTDSGVVAPEPAATLWGDTASSVQNLYVAETSSAGKMTKSWQFTGTAIQVGLIGHGPQTNDIDSYSGLKAMLDKQHLVIKGGFRQILTLPDGTQWSSATKVVNGTNTTRANDKDQVPFLMKLDVNSANGIGAGTTGWSKVMDEDHAGGVILHFADGDTYGDVIVSYTAYSGFNATATYLDGYGRVKCCGAKTDPAHYVSKLSGADGTELWKHEVPHHLNECRLINDGSFYCVYKMSASDGALNFNNGVTMPAVTSGKAGLVKFNSLGMAQWAKATQAAGDEYNRFGVSRDGTLLAIASSQPGSGGYGPSPPDLLSRIDTTAGSEGTLLWTDKGIGYGSHGFRGVEVADDGSQVTVFGQVVAPSTVTLTDSTGSTHTARSRGSYDVVVAAFDAADGTGKWAIDGGSDGLDYFFAFASDPDTNDVYVGGAAYDTPKSFTWGDTTRANAMRMYTPSSSISGYVGTQKAFHVQLKSTSTLPTCLDSCGNGGQPTLASDVKAGYCYIDRHCYSAGDFAPYLGAHCMKCDPTASATAPVSWSGPDTSTMCYIGGQCLDDGTFAKTGSGYSVSDDPCRKCHVATSTSAYTDVKGCMLDMSTFNGGTFAANGSSMGNVVTALQGTVAAMTTASAAKDAEVASMQANTVLLNTQLASALKVEDCGSNEVPAWAIILIVIVGVMFLLVLVILAVVVSR
jgi:hypothetical protein